MCQIYDFEYYIDRQRIEHAGYSRRACERLIQIKKEQEQRSAVYKMIEQDLEAIDHI